jgi:hypothetical protein
MRDSMSGKELLDRRDNRDEEREAVERMVMKKGVSSPAKGMAF